MIEDLPLQEIVFKYASSSSRLLVLDYEGTLIPLTHQRVKQEESNSILIDLLSRLTQVDQNQVMLISDGTKEHLSQIFGHLRVILVAEQGGYYREPRKEWSTVFSQPGDWVKKSIQPLNTLVSFHKGSYLEEKEYALTWHYGESDEKVFDPEKKQILAALRSLPIHDQFIIHENEDKIELRTRGVDKASFIARWIGNKHYDFILAMGNGAAEEDLFKVLDHTAFTITVGRSEDTSGRYFIKDQNGVLSFLESLLRQH